MFRIDTHSHIIPEVLPRFSEKFGYGDFITLDHQRPGYANMMKGDTFFREVKANCWNPEIRIQEYRALGVQVQVISTIPVMFSYWARAADTLEISRFLNDHIAEVCERYPTHFAGLATVPMQDAALAVDEIRRCKESLGLAGIQIGTNINNLNLSEPQFDPVWEACESLGMCVLVHPWDMMGKNYMERYWLPWLVGMPAETTRAVCSMIFGGVFDRFPRLRVNFSHGGGSFLTTFGRIEHGYRARPDLVAVDNPTPPREYLGHFWVDTITHDPVMLRHIINTIGSNRVMIGSDYPFPLGDLEIGKIVEDLHLPPMDLENVRSRAALEWLGLDAARFALPVSPAETAAPDS